MSVVTEAGTIEDSVFWSSEYTTSGGGGPSPISGVQATRPDYTEEYLSGGLGYSGQIGLASLPESIDDLTRAIGYRAYDAMLQTPEVASSVRTLILGTMAGDLTLTPTFDVEPGQKGLDRDQRRARDGVDFCQRLMDRVEGFRAVIQQLLACVHRGNKLGEMVGREETDGPDKGRLVLDRIKVKRSQAWQFIIDDTYEVQGILYRDRNGTLGRLPREKCMWFTFMPEDGDPRGVSILRAAFAAWNLLTKLYPQYYKYLRTFAVPSLVGELAEGDVADRLVDGKLLSAQQYFKWILERFQNGAVVIIPNGARVIPIFAQGEGQAFLNAMEFLGRQIIFAILMQTRATKEAQNGSKADSETSTDILDLLVAYVREMAGEAIRNQCFKRFMALNFGDEFAHRYTPYVYFGSGAPADFVARANALATLVSSGAVTPSIEADTYVKCGLLAPDREADDAAKLKAMKDQQSIIGSNGTSGSDSGGDGGGDGGGLPPRGDVPQVE